ncbi:MAG: large conductance mechanosensitive channel protein MscL [bacterium]|nr:large conductance mechanosensitive channel protein MscL [bacterium]
MKKFLKEFREFVLKGNAIDLAIGVIIGAAFSGLVTSLVNDIISPLIGIFTKVDLSNLSFVVFSAEIFYGAFLTALINFVIMALVIFLLMKLMKKIRGFKRQSTEEAPAVKECPYCLNTVKAGASKCQWCGSKLEK